MHRTCFRWLALLLLACGQRPDAGEAPAGALAPNEVIVCLGDSITQQGNRPNGYVGMFRAAVAAAVAGGKVVGAGVSGNRVRDLLKRFDKDVAARKPTLVTVYIGINDVWHGERGSTPEQYEADLTALLARIAAIGARAVVLTPTVIGEKKAGANKHDAQLDQYAEIARTVAAKASAPVVDLRRAFVAHLEANNAADAGKGVLTGDGVHLNAAGNRLIAQQLCTAFGIAFVEPPPEAPKAKPEPVQPRESGAP